MPSFYFTNDPAKSIDVSLFKKYYTHEKTVREKEALVHFFYNTNDSAMIASGEDNLFSTGVFVYKEEWGTAALELFYADLQQEKDLSRMLADTHGQFCLLVHFQNKIRIITDKTGSIPVYCYRKGNTVEMSNIFLPLAKNNGVTLNYHWLGQYLSQGNKQNAKNVIYFDKTIACEIDICDAGSIYTGDHPVSHEKYYDIEAGFNIGTYAEPRPVIEKTKQILLKNLSFLSKEKHLYCDVTGGFDTRTTLAILMDNKLRFDAGNQIPTEYKHLSNTGKYSDLTITDEIQEKFGLPFHRFDETKFEPDREKFYQMAYDFFSLEEKGWTYPRRLAYYNYIRSQLEDNVLISGLFGTELLTELSFPATLTGESKDLDPFLARYYPYLDLIRDGYYSGQQYHACLKAGFEKIFEKIGSHSLKDAGTYIFYTTFFRQKFSRYHGNANAVLPTYSPFIEADFIRFMIQTSSAVKNRYLIQRTIISDLNPTLGDINTTHGYPATKITYRNFFRFARILYTKEANLQYIGPVDRCINSITESVKGFVKRNTWSRNAGMWLYQRIYRNQNYRDFELSEYKRAKETIEKNAGEMPVFGIVDYEKFKNVIKHDEGMIQKVLHVNSLMTEIKFL